MSSIANNTRSKRKKLEEFKGVEQSHKTKEVEESIFHGMPPLCHCVICFVDMGDCNPRQYCEKYYCPYSEEDPNELTMTRLTNLKHSSKKDDPEVKSVLKLAKKYFYFV